MIYAGPLVTSYLHRGLREDAVTELWQVAVDLSCIQGRHEGKDVVGHDLARYQDREAGRIRRDEHGRHGFPARATRSANSACARYSHAVWSYARKYADRSPRQGCPLTPEAVGEIAEVR